LAQHISRRELKKDEVRETLAHGAEAVLSHQTLTTYLLLAVVVVLGGFFGWKAYAQRQTAKASAAFDDAMKTFQARVRTPTEPAGPTEVTYVDEKNKYADALKKFEDVAKKYGRTRPGQLASYYAGLCDERLGNNDAARKWLQGVAEGSTEDFSAMARFELAQIDDRTGKGDEAEKLYKQLIDKPAVLVPKPVVMMALADHYRQKNPTEAAKVYSDIKAQYPDTPIAMQADQALSLLPAGKT
jgi:predicted negative regulator of RcsB-dependent stress response